MQRRCRNCLGKVDRHCGAIKHSKSSTELYRHDNHPWYRYLRDACRHGSDDRLRAEASRPPLLTPDDGTGDGAQPGRDEVRRMNPRKPVNQVGPTDQRSCENGRWRACDGGCRHYHRRPRCRWPRCQRTVGHGRRATVLPIPLYQSTRWSQRPLPLGGCARATDPVARPRALLIALPNQLTTNRRHEHLRNPSPSSRELP
mmetsp:Transcript_28439/g.74732  ORF Transcript_28439/g.74732 Transcript_28439/m.74732 type:complete len:200 (-) Transcript_28439:6-605(-)